MSSTTQIELNPRLIGAVFGKLDENIRKIEGAFSVTIVNRGESVLVSGRDTEKAAQVLNKLAAFAQKREDISEQTVNYLIASLEDEDFKNIEKISDDQICLNIYGRPIKPKTVGQKAYVDLIRRNTLVFSVGPAGTGKTYLAMAMAITAFKNNDVSRIILTRPAIEAGEKLGFLPGDLQQKVDPYLRPLYDALHEIMGHDSFQKNQERGLIEVAPLAYMRGRTLDNSFIVLDEAQNTTSEQMKMFLTRIGFGSKAVITGDLTQVDLPEGKKSGLREAVAILANVEDIGISYLTKKDVVRHPLVQKIVDAYEKHGAKKARRTRGARQ
ncbi:MAG: PhoH family protein [Clostridiales bacterium]|jgi:phosphate starvation-inducible PhoH-like protein|nr:PhoH family protein [Clostridiales bacterium]